MERPNGLLARARGARQRHRAHKAAVISAEEQFLRNDDFAELGALPPSGKAAPLVRTPHLGHRISSA